MADKEARPSELEGSSRDLGSIVTQFRTDLHRLERGGGGGQIRQLGHYADMSVRDLARLAETGTVEQKRAAERALKIIKRATHYRDKQRGSG